MIENNQKYSKSKQLETKINSEHYEFFVENMTDHNQEALDVLEQCIVDDSSFSEELTLSDIYSILLLKACELNDKSLIEWVLNQSYDDNILINSDQAGNTLLVKILLLAERTNADDIDPDMYVLLQDYIEQIQTTEKYASGEFLGTFNNNTLATTAHAAQYPDFDYSMESYINTFFEPLYKDQDIQELRNVIGENTIASYYL